MRSSLLVPSALFLLTACGGSGSSSGGTDPISPGVTAPVISRQPQNLTVTAGQTATFTVTATGAAPLSYQWKIAGIDIGGAVAASYTTPVTTTGGSGSSFTVTVSNATGDVTSSAAILTVNPSGGAADTTAPSIPANVAGTATSPTTLTLYWTQSSDNVGLTGYRIYRNGSLLTTSADNRFSDSGLTQATQYSYRVAAYDAAGNVSEQSTAITVSIDVAASERLLHSENLVYQGSFLVPGDAQNNYAYGGTSIGFNPANNSLFVRGHDWYQLVGEISVPTSGISADAQALPTATILQSQTDITEGHLNDVGADGATMDGCKVGGLLVYQNRLIGTSYVYYDAGGNAQRSHFASGLDLSEAGDFSGMHAVGTYNPGFVAGYMGLVPSEWQTALGGPVLTGLCGVPIISRSSFGPAASVFDPATLGQVDPAPAQLLVGYPAETPTLGTWGNASEANPEFNMACSATGIVFPEDADSVLFFGSTGIGIPCYGAGTSDPTLDHQPVPGTNGEVLYVYDPVSSAKGCHAYPYVAYVWAYRARDLEKVANGLAQPWDIVPYATWELPFPFGTEGSDRICGAAYDPATHRIFLSQYNAIDASPIIHVYQVQ